MADYAGDPFAGKKIRCAVNGFGRVGRIVARIAYKSDVLELVHINEPSGDVATNAYLLQYDTAHGTWEHECAGEGDKLTIGAKELSYSQERDPAAIPWGDLGVDLVLECSGQFLTREKLEPFFTGGAKRVVVSAACKGDILNIVYGCNHDEYDPEDTKHHIVTAASCTTNCIAPPIKVIKENIGIVHGSITTMHCITNTQPLVDAIVGKKPDPRRARSGMSNLAPTSTNSATAITMIYPDLKGKLNGMAVRIPLMYTSLTDLTLELARPTTVEEVNGFLEAASKSAPLAGILGFETKPLVSSDYRSDTRSGIVDALSTMVVDETQLKLYVWYDNEYGYCARMVDVATMVARSLMK